MAGSAIARGVGEAGFDGAPGRDRGVEQMDELKVYDVALGQNATGDAAGRSRRHRASELLAASAGSRMRASRAGCPIRWWSTSSSARRTPCWQQAGQLMLIDVTGIELEPVTLDAMPDLPLVIGPGANRQAAALDRAARCRAGAQAAGGRRRMGRQPPLEPDASRPARCWRCREGEAGGADGADHLRPARRGERGCSAAARPLRHARARAAIVRVSREPGSIVPRSRPKRRRRRRRHAESTDDDDRGWTLETSTPPTAGRRLVTALDIGSSQVSAMIAGLSRTGEMLVLGTGHRASQGIKRGYVTDMERDLCACATRSSRPRRIAGTNIDDVWVGCSARRPRQHRSPGRGRASAAAASSRTTSTTCWSPARDAIQPEGRMVLHAQPAHYTLDGAHGRQESARPPCRPARRSTSTSCSPTARRCATSTECVRSPISTSRRSSPRRSRRASPASRDEERDLGVALVEFGGEVTNVSSIRRRHAGRPDVDPDGRRRHHRRDRLGLRHPPLPGRAAEMRLRLGDRRARATITR